MVTYYCKWCGTARSSVSSLTSSTCSKNPEGKYHQPYEGTEKREYICKYCGTKRTSISSLCASSCSKSPSRYHSPL